MSHRVLVIGESLIDIVSTESDGRIEHVGGSPANVAVGLARLDHEVDFVTSLGRDERGARIAAHLERHGVAVARGSHGDHPTSTAAAAIDVGGGAEYSFDLHWHPPKVELPEHVGHVHAGSIACTLEPGSAQVLEGLRAAREVGSLSYDPNVRPSIMGDLGAVRHRVEEIVALSDVVKASDDDLTALYAGQSLPEVLELWGRMGPGLVVVTLGAAGVSFRVSSTGEIGKAPTRAERVVDTVGAGDSFMAGLVSGLLSAGLLGGIDARTRLARATLDEVRPAIERGLSCSAVTVGHAGAYAPSLDEL